MRRIWVDADACPKAVKEILYKAANRTKTKLILVANSYLTHPNSPFIKSIQVHKGFDSADSYILNHASSNDLVITADIPLASALIGNKVTVINPRGEQYSENSIKQKLQFRDINEQIRSYGGQTSGMSTFGIKEKTAFANLLDQWLAKS